MTVSERLLADTWVRGCIAVGVAMLAVSSIAGLPWVLWAAWLYLLVLSAVDADT